MVQRTSTWAALILPHRTYHAANGQDDEFRRANKNLGPVGE
jgi:hypothetical protein